MNRPSDLDRRECPICNEYESERLRFTLDGLCAYRPNCDQRALRASVLAEKVIAALSPQPRLHRFDP